MDLLLFSFRQLIIISLLLVASCGQRTNSPSLAPYEHVDELTEVTPFTADKLIAQNGIQFSQDGKTLYLSNSLDTTFSGGRYAGRTYSGIFVSHHVEGQWTEPELLDFGWLIDAYHPVLSADNSELYFNSRSDPDSLGRSMMHNIWRSARTTDGWGAPSIAPTINSTGHDSYPSLAANGNIYFNSDRAGGQGGMDIYQARLVDGRFEEPVNLVALNSADEENDLVIDPQERFIIFNRYIHESAGLDLYISFNSEDGWTIPRLLDKVNNAEKWELTPTISPDASYFFFELDNKIMQIDLGQLIFTDELPGLGRRMREEE